MKNLKKNKRAGFTLVEILLVVGFIALAGIGIYTVYSKVQRANIALQEGRNLDTIRAGIKNLYGGRKNYTGVNNTIINDARITPDSMRAVPYVAGDNRITNSFGGNVAIGVRNTGASVDNLFSVVYYNVPGEVCAKLATGAGTGWDEIILVGAALTIKEVGKNNLDVAALATECAKDNGAGVAMMFNSL